MNIPLCFDHVLYRPGGLGVVSYFYHIYLYIYIYILNYSEMYHICAYIDFWLIKMFSLVPGAQSLREADLLFCLLTWQSPVFFLPRSLVADLSPDVVSFSSAITAAWLPQSTVGMVSDRICLRNCCNLKQSHFSIDCEWILFRYPGWIVYLLNSHRNWFETPKSASGS